MQNQTADLLLLNEVFMTPSVETAKQNLETPSAASCSGRCKTGNCMPSHSTDLSYNSPEFYAQ
jgi:hypothetical protein